MSSDWRAPDSVRTIASHRNRLRIPMLLIVVALAVLASACGSGPPSSGFPRAEPSDGVTTRSSPAGPAPSNASPQATSNAPAAASPGTTGSGTTAPPAAQGSTDNAGPAPAKFPWKNEVPVSASVDPECVSPGGAVILAVHTKPGAAIAYQAVYSDSRGGGAPPFGAGYGGNDKGYAAPDGSWTSTWVVSPKAPPGPARVDVIVGWNSKWGYDGPKFAVADSSGSC